MPTNTFRFSKSISILLLFMKVEPSIMACGAISGHRNICTGTWNLPICIRTVTLAVIFNLLTATLYTFGKLVVNCFILHKFGFELKVEG